jgi:hypothetical protein
MLSYSAVSSFLHFSFLPCSFNWPADQCRQAIPNCPVLDVLSPMSCPGSPIYAAMFLRSCPLFPVLAFLSRLSFTSLLSRLSCSGCPVLAVLPRLSCSSCLVPAYCPQLSCPLILSELLCSCRTFLHGCSVPDAPFQLFCSGYPALAVLSRAVQSRRYPTPVVLSWLSYTRCPVLAILGCIFLAVLSVR